jgi:hypothetical protein
LNGTAHSNGDGRRPPAATCGHGEKLSRRQNAAIAALLAEPTIGRAASKAKVGERTLRRWMTLLDFKREYAAARVAALDEAIKQLQVASNVAVRVLLEIAENTAAPEAARVSAARAIIVEGRTATEVMTIVERLEAVEALVMNRNAGNGRHL